MSLKKITYNPKKVNPDDTSIVEAGLIFNTLFEDFISLKDVPLSGMENIKYIGLGNGGDGGRTDGSYVFYKNFGENAVSICFQFSSVNPHMEEFESQWDVVEKVHNSFMNKEWQYKYEDFSCGEYCPWEYKGKEAKELIGKWESNDPTLQSDLALDSGNTLNDKNNEKSGKKKSSQDENYSLDPIEVEHIDFESAVFAIAGFNYPDEERIKAEITQRSGNIRASISDKINYFIVPDGDIKINAKMKKVLDLLKNGASIAIIRISECRKHMRILDEELFGAEDAKIAWDYRISLVEDKVTLIHYIGTEKEVIIPESVGKYPVVSIAKSCFNYGNKTLEKVVVPKSITTIEERAFDQCENLYSVVLPEGVQVIKRFAFCGCSSLDNLTIPNTVTTIEDAAVYNCEKLSSVFIPASVVSLGAAFVLCNGISEIKVDETNRVYDSRNNCNAVIEKETNTLVFGCKSTIIPKEIKAIGARAFCGLSSLEIIEMPDGIEEIGDEAFLNCKKLGDLQLPMALIKIGKSSFYGCSEIKEVKLPPNVEVVGENAFCRCNIREITISERLKADNKNFLDEWRIQKVYGTKKSIAQKIAKSKQAEYIEI